MPVHLPRYAQYESIYNHRMKYLLKKFIVDNLCLYTKPEMEVLLTDLYENKLLSRLASTDERTVIELKHLTNWFANPESYTFIQEVYNSTDWEMYHGEPDLPA